MRSGWGIYRHCSLLHISLDNGNRGTKAFPQSLYSCQPPICLTLSKQHLSHSLCLGFLSHSVHLGKAPAHKAHRDKACSSHSHSWLHGALLRHLMNSPFSWGKELNLQHRKVQVLLLQFLCERTIFLSQSCDNRPSQSKR